MSKRGEPALEMIEALVNDRPHQLQYRASEASVLAMNGLISRALEHCRGLRSQSRYDRHLFIATALGYDNLPGGSTKNLTQAEVSALIQVLKDEESWELKPGTEHLIAEIERACLHKMGQKEIPWE